MRIRFDSWICSRMLFLNRVLIDTSSRVEPAETSHNHVPFSDYVLHNLHFYVVVPYARTVYVQKKTRGNVTYLSSNHEWVTNLWRQFIQEEQESDKCATERQRGLTIPCVTVRVFMLE